jgi:hypothetical protein
MIQLRRLGVVLFRLTVNVMALFDAALCPGGEFKPNSEPEAKK